METLGDKFDFIIIGAGTSGSIITRILSDKTVNSILLLECGPNQIDNRNVTDPAAYLNVQSDHDATFDYTTNIDPNIGYKKTIVSSGIGFGGHTCSNNMMAIKPSDTYLTELEKQTGIQASLLKIYMNSIEKYVTQPDTIPTANRGDSGPLTVTQLPTGNSFYNFSPLAQTPDINNIYPGMLASIYSVDNIPPSGDYNQSELFVANRYQLFAKQTINRWFRQDAGAQFLNTIIFPNGTGIPITTLGEIYKRNLRVYDRAKVTKIFFKPIKTDCVEEGCDCHKKVKPYAVETLIDNHLVSFEARRGVIICCGAIETPLLLERSGIGSSRILDALSVNPVIYNDNVGNNLSGHYGAYMDVKLSVPNENNLSLVSMLPGDAISSRERIYQLYAYNFMSKLRFELIQLSGGTVSGSIHSNTVLGKESYTQPQISYPILTQDVDRIRLALGFINLSSALNDYITEYTTNIGPITAEWDYGDPLVLTDEQLLSVISGNNIKCNFTGTARMGAPGYGVVDANFQVYGTCGLYIVDSSVLPITPDSQSEWLVMALGMYFAENVVNCCKLRNLQSSIPKEVFMKERIVSCRKCGTGVCKCSIITQYSKVDTCYEVEYCDIETLDKSDKPSKKKRNHKPEKTKKRNIEFTVHVSD